MHTSESPLSPHRVGSTAKRSQPSAAKRCAQVLASTLLICLTLSACGGSSSGSSDSAGDSNLGSDNKTREVRCAR